MTGWTISSSPFCDSGALKGISDGKAVPKDKPNQDRTRTRKESSIWTISFHMEVLKDREEEKRRFGAHGYDGYDGQVGQGSQGSQGSKIDRSGCVQV